jgi:hypothetical protein
VYNISDYWANVQRRLFPALEEVLPSDTTQRHRQLIVVLEVVRVEEHIPSSWRRRLGRRRHDRRALARAFLAKACFNLPTTEALIEHLRVDPVLRQLCGWEQRRQVPSASTFSRAFAELARSGLLDQVHAAAVQKYAGEVIFWHVSRDSTAIPARERVQPNPDREAAEAVEAAEPKPRRGRGRPRKDAPLPPPPPTRLKRQYHASPAETEALLAELPTTCGVGHKTHPSGWLERWKGYKFHVDVGDEGLPLLAVTTSAWLHDSQVAIPMLRKTAARVTSWYDLMDSAYDAEHIVQASLDLGHVPIIDQNRRRVAKLPLDPPEALRYRKRTQSERFNGWLKDDYGGRQVRVRGGPKVHTHLMCGLLVIFARVIISWAN